MTSADDSTPTEPGPSGADGSSRRRFLGYLGSAVAGAAVAAPAAARLGGSESSADSASGSAGAGSGTAPPSPTPYGVHQPGVERPNARVTTVVALDLPQVRRGSVAQGRDALARLLRLWGGDVVALSQSRGAPGDTAPGVASEASGLDVVIGLGTELVDQLVPQGAPPGLVDVPAFDIDQLQSRWSGGDAVLMVTGRDGTSVDHAVRRMLLDAEPFGRLRWRQQGSWNGYDADGSPVTGRNHFDQVDGTGNPALGSADFDQTVWIDEGAWAGGSSLVVRRIQMDLEEWDRLKRFEMERTVGRDLDVGAPLTGSREHDDLDLEARDDRGELVIPRSAHARLSHPSRNGGRRIFRRGANYTETVTGPDGTTVESGLVFLSFQASVADQFLPIQRRLAEGDALNEWTTTVGTASFAILPGFEKGSWPGEGLLT